MSEYPIWDHFFSAYVVCTTPLIVLPFILKWLVSSLGYNDQLFFCNSGYHTLYQWYQQVESEHFPDPTGLRARIEQWTFGLYPACIKYLMSAFDVPEV